MSVDVQYCPECGSQNSGDAVFCASCGKKFSAQSQRLGDNNQQPPMQDQNINYQTPQSQPQFDGTNLNKENQVSGLVEGSIKMITDPNTYAVRLLADPDAPSSSILVYIRALILAAVSYFTFVRDDYFDLQYRDIIESNLEGTGLTINEVREVYTIGFPVFTIIFVVGFWYIGSFILGYLIKGGLHQNSPLNVDRSYSMRQLNGYRQPPKIVAELIALALVITSPPMVFFGVVVIVRSIAEIIFAIILWRGIGEHVGYFGSVHKIIAGLIIFFEVFSYI